MNFNFDELGKVFNKHLEKGKAIAGDTMEIQKLKNQIRNLEKGNDDDTESLGRAVYQDFLDGKEVDEKAAELCAAIKSREEGIEEALQKINQIKGDLVCPNCGKPVTKDMSFCPYCGTKLPEVVEEEEEVVEGEVEETTEAPTEEAVEEAAPETPQE